MEALVETPFAALPEDMVAVVLSHVDVASLSASARTCQLWNRLLKLPWVLQSIWNSFEKGAITGQSITPFKLKLLQGKFVKHKRIARFMLIADAIKRDDLATLVNASTTAAANGSPPIVDPNLLDSERFPVEALMNVSSSARLDWTALDLIFTLKSPKSFESVWRAWSSLPEYAGRVDSLLQRIFEGNYFDNNGNNANRADFEFFKAIGRFLRSQEEKVWIKLCIGENYFVPIANFVKDPYNLNPSCVFSDGRRPVHLRVGANFGATVGRYVEQLSDLGADIMIPDPNGRTIWDYALEENTAPIPVLCGAKWVSAIPPDAIHRLLHTKRERNYVGVKECIGYILRATWPNNEQGLIEVIALMVHSRLGFMELFELGFLLPLVARRFEEESFLMSRLYRDFPFDTNAEGYCDIKFCSDRRLSFIQFLEFKSDGTLFVTEAPTGGDNGNTNPSTGDPLIGSWVLKKFDFGSNRRQLPGFQCHFDAESTDRAKWNGVHNMTFFPCLDHKPSTGATETSRKAVFGIALERGVGACEMIMSHLIKPADTIIAYQFQ